MTDYKQLCSELTDELESWIAYGDEVDIANAHVLIDRARAALAEPPPPKLSGMLDSLPNIKSRIEELQKDIEELQEEIRDLRISYLRLANAVAHIMPDRDKFFADLIPDSDD